MIKINVITLFLILFSGVCFGYIGPGAGVSSVGTAVIFLFVIFFLFLGFLWYPIKALFNRDSNKRNNKLEEGLEESIVDSDSDSAGKF